MQLIRYRECPSTTWKNGGGSTKQLLISPSHADLSDFDYRISIASVSSSGPFSLFIGIDRQLCLLEGEGLKLHIQGDSLNSSTLLTPNNAPFNFKGETQIESQLLDDPVLDFNVMTKRDKYSSNIEKSALTTLLSLIQAKTHSTQHRSKTFACHCNYSCV